MELTGVFSDVGWVNGYQYTLRVRSAMATEIDAEVTSIIATHEFPKSNSEVTAIVFQNLDLKKIPRGLNKFFPNLRCLELKRCQIASVTRSDLVGLENLDCLHIGSNLIKTLPNGLLTNMKNLRYLYLLENQITHLSADFLNPLNATKCEFVDLSYNTSINDFYQKGIHGSLKLLKKAIAKKCPPALEKKSNSAVPDLVKKLFSTGLMSDFTINVGEAKIKVHKNILAACSTTFSTMFEHDFEETRTSAMTIHDHSEEAVRDFLRFIYTGEIESAENAMEIYELSVLYHVPELKNFCEEMIAENLDESNVLEVFNIGELHSSNRLKKAAVRKMIAAFPGKNLDAEMLSEPAEFYKFVKAKRELDSLLEKLEM